MASSINIKNIGAILSRVSSAISDSPVVDKGKLAALEAAYVTKKLLRSTGKAAWIAGTTFIILAVPIIIASDLEARLDALENHEAALYGVPVKY